MEVRHAELLYFAPTASVALTLPLLVFIQEMYIPVTIS
jgi:hypothetical protein